jgi:hypothetical protein
VADEATWAARSLSPPSKGPPVAPARPEHKRGAGVHRGSVAQHCSTTVGPTQQPSTEERRLAKTSYLYHSSTERRAFWETVKPKTGTTGATILLPGRSRGSFGGLARTRSRLPFLENPSCSCGERQPDPWSVRRLLALREEPVGSARGEQQHTTSTCPEDDLEAAVGIYFPSDPPRRTWRGRPARRKGPGPGVEGRPRSAPVSFSTLPGERDFPLLTLQPKRKSDNSEAVAQALR